MIGISELDENNLSEQINLNHVERLYYFMFIFQLVSPVPSSVELGNWILNATKNATIGVRTMVFRDTKRPLRRILASGNRKDRQHPMGRAAPRGWFAPQG